MRVIFSFLCYEYVMSSSKHYPVGSCTAFLASLALNMFLYLLSRQMFVLVLDHNCILYNGSQAVTGLTPVNPIPSAPWQLFTCLLPQPSLSQCVHWYWYRCCIEKRCKAENIFPSPNIIQTAECVNSTQKKIKLTLYCCWIWIWCYFGEKNNPLNKKYLVACHQPD